MSMISDLSFHYGIDAEKEIKSLLEKEIREEIWKGKMTWFNLYPSIKIEMIQTTSSVNNPDGFEIISNIYSIKLNENVFSCEEMEFLCEDKRVPEMILMGISSEEIVYMCRGTQVSKNVGII